MNVFFKTAITTGGRKKSKATVIRTLEALPVAGTPWHFYKEAILSQNLPSSDGDRELFWLDPVRVKPFGIVCEKKPNQEPVWDALKIRLRS